MYILKLLLIVGAAVIEVLVTGSKFLYACVAACQLSHVLTPSINSLLLKRSEANSSSGR
jgi:hypothetical protein